MSNNNEKIKLGIEATSVFAGYPTGISKYTTSLIDALLGYDRFNKYFDLTILYKLSRYKMRHKRYLPNQNCVRWHLGNIWPLKRNLNIVHSTHTQTTNWKNSVKIATIYDMVIYLNEYKDYLHTSKKFYKIKWDKLKKTAQKADAILTISNCSKRDILKFLDFPEENIYVVYPGVEKCFFDYDKTEADNQKIISEYNLNREYLLFVRLVSFRKNILNLIKAYHLNRENVMKRFAVPRTAHCSDGCSLRSSARH